MRDRGVTLIELLIAMTVMSVILAVIAVFMAQQSRVVALSQSINEAELTARTVAEAVLQDMQLAGSRAVYMNGVVSYADISSGCNESSRSACVAATQVGALGAITTPGSAADINGYTISYRTSLVPASPCRRIDFAFVGTSLYRSDRACAES